MVASGIHAPGVPSAVTGRRWKGPKVEGPKVLRGSKVARMVWESSRMSDPEAMERVVWRAGSVVEAISTRSERRKGARDFRKKVSWEPRGRSLGEASAMEDAGEGLETRRERMETEGREGRTVTETGRVRPSRR
jgi:hypothetical protein